jgi:hypothetical protein
LYVPFIISESVHLSVVKPREVIPVKQQQLHDAKQGLENAIGTQIFLPQQRVLKFVENLSKYIAQLQAQL